MFCCCAGYGQQFKIDSMSKLLQVEGQDSNKVTLLWNLAQEYQISRPDSSLLYAQQANSLAEKIHFVEGTSRSLNQIANAFNRVGNYPRALEYYIKELKIEEKRQHPENLAIALINISTVFLFQQEYRNALNYSFLAKSVIDKNNINRLQRYSLLNIGDIYEKYDHLDSAMYFTNLAYDASNNAKDDDLKGTALNNFANICLKLKTYDLALKNYRKALPLLKTQNDYEMISEADIGLAKTFLKTGKEDSAIFYARESYLLSFAGGFLSKTLDASIFLKNYFEKHHTIDSAYKYQTLMQNVKDSINSVERIKNGQLLALNEQIRQKEFNDQKLIEEQNLTKRIQYIGIGVLIPILFLLTLFLRNKKVRPRYIEALGLISLLMFFEYITLLLHPFVLDFTNHLPLLEVIVFSGIAALLTRTHHKIEYWFLKRLGKHNSSNKEIVRS